ncbi:killer toxin [Basidiobolus meristosporus CBS 931.73]|uniref:Killer toxin n=1 Tax=Basidiobolus meristosporus CBS 931.73 TaxID=1314790 RepID=A0A1Y1VSJ0_9FUNG|nr:killer toxin [Basidiobolus meristosporus CBS 931.73]|eukprot:ORX63724.1 killer toxin [Basidiobolus meristosporus CBS 931.73]
MKQSIATAAAIFALSIGTTNGLGINCRGSSDCDFVANSGHVIAEMRQLCGGDQNQQFSNGQHIITVNEQITNFPVRRNFCAFTQNMGDRTIPKWKACQLLGFLADHGCNQCGSVPVDFPNVNDVSKGQLTVNRC